MCISFLYHAVFMVPFVHVTVQFRLANSRYINEGRIEVLYNGTWGTICDDNWDTPDADVVCRVLGFATGAAMNQYYGPGEGPIWLDDVMCRGHERGLRECNHGPWGEHDCTHDDDAGVICSKYPSWLREKDCGNSNARYHSHALSHGYLWDATMWYESDPRMIEYEYWINPSGPWCDIKLTSYQCRKFHCGDKTILRPSYLHNELSYTGKMTPLYWIGALVLKPQYPRITRSETWLLMPWLHASPEPQQPWCWYCRMDKQLFFTMRASKYLCWIIIKTEFILWVLE